MDIRRNPFVYSDQSEDEENDASSTDSDFVDRAKILFRANHSKNQRPTFGLGF